MLQNFRASKSTLFSDMTDNDHSGVCRLGGLDDEVAGISDLGDGARRGGDFVDGESLN